MTIYAYSFTSVCRYNLQHQPRKATPMRTTLTYHFGTPGQGGDVIKFRTATSFRYIVATVNGNGKVVTEYRTDDYSRAVAKLDKVCGYSGRIFDTEDGTMRGTDTENNGERGQSFRWWYVGPGMSKVSGQRGPSYRHTATVDRETDAAHLAARAPTAYDYPVDNDFAGQGSEPVIPVEFDRFDTVTIPAVGPLTPATEDYTRRIGGSDYANPARSANLKSVAAQATAAQRSDVTAHYMSDGNGWYLSDNRTDEIGLPVNGTPNTSAESKGLWATKLDALDAAGYGTLIDWK